MNKKIMVFGDSHIATLAKGYNKLKDSSLYKIPDFEFYPLGKAKCFLSKFYKFTDSSVEFSIENPRSNLTRLEFDDTNLYVFSAPLQSLRFLRSYNWENHLPYDFCEDKTPISEAVFKRSILEWNKYNFEFLEYTSKSGLNISVIEPPKLFNHNEWFMLENQETILKLEDKFRSIVKDHLCKLNIPVISLSKEVLNSNGTMREAYQHEKQEDYFHGNSDFGEVMIKKVIDSYTEDLKII